MPSSRMSACRDGAVRSRAVDFERAAVDQLQFLAQVKFVTLGVAAEIVVIVQDQDARIRAVTRAKEMRGR